MIGDQRDMLGVYAVGALEPHEVDAVESFIAEHPDVQQEVARHFEVVELLGAMTQAQPPAEIWERVAEALDEPQDELAGRRAGRSPRGVTTARLAVAAALVLVLGVVAGLQGARISDLNQTLADRDQEIGVLAGALADPLAAAAQQASDSAFETVRLSTETAPDIDMTIVLLEDGRAYVTSSNLNPLPTDRTYQLWAIMDDDRIISAAVLGQDPVVDTFVVDLDGLVGFAVTEEVDGGVVASESSAVVVGLIDA